jgi:hypothetical protein
MLPLPRPLSPFSPKLPRLAALAGHTYIIIMIIKLTSFPLPLLRVLALLDPLLGCRFLRLVVEGDLARCGGGDSVLQK